jgi:hypothetical protein
MEIGSLLLRESNAQLSCPMWEFHQKVEKLLKDDPVQRQRLVQLLNQFCGHNPTTKEVVQFHVILLVSMCFFSFILRIQFRMRNQSLTRKKNMSSHKC